MKKHTDTRPPRFPMHPVLWALYQFFRVLSWVSLHVFFRKRCTISLENARFEAPAIVVSNHPNTLLDPLNIGIHIRQEVFFMANYGLFKHPLSNWIFRKLYCIPVKRREDVTEGETRNNDSAFEASFEHLEKGGVLYIAAEGTSWMNRWVRPFKTGAARIALQTEARNHWQLGVKIIPVGLSYEQPNMFRSRMYVHFGSPILIKNWQADFEQNPADTVQKITQYIENQVRSLTIDTRDETGENFIGQLETLLQNSHPLPCHESFKRSQQLARQFLDHPALQRATQAYFERLATLGLTDQVVVQGNHPETTADRWEMLVLIMGSPFFLLGYLFWWLPCRLPQLLTQQLKLYVGYDATVKILGGIITFSVALAGVFFCVREQLGHTVGAIAAVLMAILLGYWVEYFQQIFQKWQIRRQAKRYCQNKEQWTQIQAQREVLIGKILGNGAVTSD